MITALAVGLISVASWQTPVPGILIVYSEPPAKESSGYAAIANYMANELDKSGRVTSIVADVTDPIYRQAMIDGKVPELKGALSERQSQEISQKLGTTFLFYIKAAPTAGRLAAEGTLVKAGRPLWKERQTIGMSIGEKNDVDGASMSLASTWTSKLLAGPLKSLEPKPLVETPVADPGIVKPNLDPTPPVNVPNPTAWKAPIDEAMAKNDQWGAVSLARAAVDMMPDQLDRRRALIDVLVKVGRPVIAADEAARVAGWAPMPAEWRVLAAKAYLSANEPSKAREQLNEAVAREPDAPETRRLLAEIAILEMQPIVATEHLDVAIHRDDDPDGYVLRAVARAMIGGADGLVIDWKQAKRTPGFVSTARYGFAYTALDRVTVLDITQTKDLLARCVVSRLAPQNAEDRDQLEKRVRARLAYLGETGVPDSNKKSFERFSLAQRVLIQCLQSISEYLESGDAETATDARINLGEALKQVSSARDLYTAEMAPPVR
jgi:Tfp pilus assembly protein PilF